MRSLLTTVFASGLLAFPVPSPADDGGLRALCFAPVELAARNGERIPVKREHAFDQPAPERALAPFSPVPAHLRGAIRRVNLPAGSPKLISTLR